MGFRGRGSFTRQKKCLCGIGCILLGILVLVCFLPDWLFALVLSGGLFWIGASLLGVFR